MKEKLAKKTVPTQPFCVAVVFICNKTFKK